MEWPIPKTLKHIIGFLGLIGYYYKFVKNNGRIGVRVTKLLKKDTFSCPQEATQAFEKLKEAMCRAPVLATLDFTKT